MSCSLPAPGASTRAARSLLLVLAVACHAQERPAPGAVRLAAAGARLPVPTAGQPPTAIFPGDRLPPPGTRVTCPVCGDEFLIEEAHALRHYKGTVIVFCCQRCLPHFDKDPDQFVGPGI